MTTISAISFKIQKRIRKVVVLLLSSSLILLHSLCSCAADRLPVIFIPGFLGSALTTNDGKTVWGGFPDNCDEFDALNLNSGVELRASTVLRHHKMFGIHKAVAIYERAHEVFGRKELGYQLDKDLFFFEYDWRQSNFDSAHSLLKYIHKKERDKLLTAGKFIIVAHSMGGIVARIYASGYFEALVGGAWRAPAAVITVGSPLTGTAEILKSLISSNETYQPFCKGRVTNEKLRETVASFHSTWELLPAESICCTYMSFSKIARHISPRTVQFWTDKRIGIDGLADIASNPLKIQERLQRSWKLDEIIHEKPRTDVRYAWFYGTGFPTPDEVTVFENGYHAPVFKESNFGDGTVQAWSAGYLPEHLRPVAVNVHRVPNAQHMWLFAHPYLTGALTRMLQNPFEMRNFLRQGDMDEVAEVPFDVRMESNVVRRGENIVLFGAGHLLSRKAHSLRMQILLDDGVREHSTRVVSASEDVTHGVMMPAPNTEGIYSVRLSLPSGEPLWEDLVQVTSQ